jgi:phosphohistidine phosphatase SixA
MLALLFCGFLHGYRINRMHRNRLFLLLFLISLPWQSTAAQSTAPQFAAVPPPAPGRSSTPTKEFPGPVLVAELRRGGYTIFFRHTSTDFSRDDVKSRSDDDCDNQRPLTDKGRDEARRIGNDLRKLGIPIGEVLASPRCRTVEMAKLAFGNFKIAAEARGGVFTEKPATRYDGLRALFNEGPGPGKNTIIVSHGNPFYATAGAPYLAEGEAAIIKPLVTDFDVIGRIRWDGWSALARPTP